MTSGSFEALGDLCRELLALKRGKRGELLPQGPRKVELSAKFKTVFPNIDLCILWFLSPLKLSPSPAEDS